MDLNPARLPALAGGAFGGFMVWKVFEKRSLQPLPAVQAYTEPGVSAGSFLPHFSQRLTVVFMV
jgi:hypothetical protein